MRVKAATRRKFPASIHNLSAKMPSHMTTQSSLQEIERGDALRDSGALDEAVIVYQQVMAAEPGLATGPYKLATAYQRLKRLDDAEAWFRQALDLDPDYPEAMNNLGIILAGRGELDAAEKLYRDALAKQIDYFEAHINLGNLLFESARRTEALYYYRRAIQLRPDSALAKERMGPLLRDLGRISEALDMLQQAVELNPKSAFAWNNLGTCHISRGDIAAAEESLQEALRHEPTLSPAWVNLMLISNWRSNDRERVYDLHRSFGLHMTEQKGTDRFTHYANVADRERRLRVGFVSGDFRRHSVSYFIQAPLSRFDRSRIEAWAYFSHPWEDDRTQELKPLFAEWRNIYGLSDDEAAAMIRRDGIDILIDLTGHTNHGRLGLFALKPAPVQVSWIGYPNTTGLSTIDYRITDEYADPAGTSEIYHTETLIRLPDSFLCYSPPKEAPDLAPPPCVENGRISFGSFNTRVKIGDETLALWRQVLAAVPDAGLVIKSAVGLAEQAGRDELLEKIKLAGIDAKRVTIHSAAGPLGDHLALYSSIDICLDTFPYQGTTTTCEALWMGVPVVTLAGEAHVSRVGVSLLSNVGLQELVAHTAAEYVRIAAGLAGDKSRLAELRATMRQRMLDSPLLDAAAMARNLEQALRRMWVGYCENRPTEAAPETNVDSNQLDIRLQGGHAISVASDFRGSMTSWIMLEQEDWFEDEIGFLRKICCPGWHALDIGANHGVYSLALASSGAAKIWAFEPTCKPRLYLRNSVALNGFETQTEICPVGLSSEPKMVNISLSGASELNTLHPMPENNGTEELVTLVTLDGLMGKEIPAGTRIDFVKLDAEGEEVAILRGGLRFFSEQSPLVMFEYKHLTSFNLELVDTFRALGYALYRLVPGLDCLVPVLRGTEAVLDAYTLNLFACKNDLAAQLDTASYLVVEENRADVALSHEWSEELFSLPALATAGEWRSFDFDSDYGRALLAWCGSRRVALPAAQRYQLLTQAFRHFQLACDHEDSHPAVVVLGIRICADAGMRSHALTFATAFLDQMPLKDEMPVDRPVPPAYAIFDIRQPESSLGEFLHESIVELRFDRGGFSQFFQTTQHWLLETGLNSPEHTPRLERSAVLCYARDGTSLQLERTAKLFQYSPDNRNPDLWLRIAEQYGFLRGDPQPPANRSNS
ncbi:MAG: FkbM family methyltransferase [Rhodocyclales bacterium]|nr:FkbM family methyltransferase [Rhodocyclales bacterium]